MTAGLEVKYADRDMASSGGGPDDGGCGLSKRR